jgi:hypothetical protein
MLDTRSEIITSIHKHVKTFGSDYTDWHIGICDEEHSDVLNFPKADPATIVFHMAPSPKDAEAILACFIFVYGMRRAVSLGGPATIVCAYKTA